MKKKKGLTPEQIVLGQEAIAKSIVNTGKRIAENIQKIRVLNERERVASMKFQGVLRSVLHPGPCVVVVNDVFVGLIPMQIAG